MAQRPARGHVVLIERSPAAASPARGSAVVLIPACVLVMLVLGAIVVDVTVVHLAARQARDAATAAAADAAAAGVDVDAVRGGGPWRLQPARAEAVARQAVEARRLPHAVRSVTVVAGPGPDQVTVTVELTVDTVFAGALPGGHDTAATGVGVASIRRR